MNTIYIVTPTKGCWGDMLNGFATDARGIRQLVQNDYREAPSQAGVDVHVDLENMVAAVPDDDGYEDTYYIQEIKRVT